MGKQHKKKFYKKKKAKTETTSSIIPIEKLKFAIGDNQGENIERLKPQSGFENIKYAQHKGCVNK